MIDIRTARHDDIERMLAIRAEAFRLHAPSAYSPQEVETLLGDVDPGELARMIDDGQLFVAEADGVVCGLAEWLEGDLRHVYVDPAMGRQGIATRLLEQAERDYRARTGHGEIHAGVALYALPFYVANGYEIIRAARAWDDSEYYEMRKTFEDRCSPS